MSFVRSESTNNVGLFQEAYKVIGFNSINIEDKNKLQILIDWFERNLSTPTKFVKTKSKGFYRKEPVAICWFYVTAHKHIENCKEIISILSKYNINILEVSTNTPGYITYKDIYQVAAVPFKDR